MALLPVNHETQLTPVDCCVAQRLFGWLIGNEALRVTVAEQLQNCKPSSSRSLAKDSIATNAVLSNNIFWFLLEIMTVILLATFCFIISLVIPLSECIGRLKSDVYLSLRKKALNWTVPRTFLVILTTFVTKVPASYTLFTKFTWYR